MASNFRRLKCNNDIHETVALVLIGKALLTVAYFIAISVISYMPIPF